MRKQRLMHIGINAHLLSLTNTYRAAGVSNYIYYLLRHLSTVDSHNRYEIYTGPWARHAGARSRLPLGDNFRLRPSWLPTQYPPVRLLWEQGAQPFHSLGLDIIHGMVNVAPIFSRAQRIITIHDLAFLHFSDKHLPAKRKYLTKMTRLSVRRAAYVIAVSESTRQDVIHLLGADPNKVVMIPEAADEEYRWLGETPQGIADIEAFRQKRGLPDRYFLYLGTLEPRKNIPLLLRAYAALHKEGANGSAGEPPKLVLAGPKGWLYDEIFAQVKASGLENHVIFPGFVPRDEITYWYNAALGFVYLSMFEGFGLPPLQAMACGVPVIVNNASALPEVVGDAGVKVNAGNDQEVTNALRQLANNADYRQDLRQRGLERASQFSWDRTAQQTLALYEAAVQKRYPFTPKPGTADI